jgi:methylated-DNA-[protein]-cysteine S-methyltransferase
MTARTGAAAGTRHTVLATRLGELTLVQQDGALTGLYFPGHWPRPDRSAFGPRAAGGAADGFADVAGGAADGFADVAAQLDDYLTGKRATFELPVLVTGTECDRQVWDLIGAVPYGQTTTYGDLARRLGPGTDPRDVGAAVGRNPLCIVIPCHRVIGSTGKLTGYAGGLARKRALLELEAGIFPLPSAELAATQ